MKKHMGLKIVTYMRDRANQFRDGGGEAFPQPRRLRNPSL